MREKGCSEDELFSFLSGKRNEDLNYSHILSSMCTVPHPVAVRAHNLFIGTNLGDPGLFPGTSRIEAMLVNRLGMLMNHPGAGGYSTSGGTESNLQALRIAKKTKNTRTPNIVVPESAHFSFEKSCDILGLEMRSAGMDANKRMDPWDAESLMDRNTIAIVGVAGSTEYGMVDPIPVLSDMASEREVFLHVDAAFGGLVVPFIDSDTDIDFSLSGVSSISVDPHKMGMSTIPAGCLLVREPELFCHLDVETPYLTVRKECTLAGTRPGASVAAAFAVLEYLGMDGMRRIARECMDNTRLLIREMESLGFMRVVEPDVNVATFECDLHPKKWVVSRTRQGHMRIVCMPHVTREMIMDFISDLGEMNA